MKECVVYSGSFNPFHIGHLKIVEELSKRFDYVILVVSVQNPFKEDNNNFNERFNNVKEIIKKYNLKNVIVEDIENKLTKPYYTINTLRKLEEKYPDFILSYAIGADNLIDFNKWKEWERFLDNYGLIVLPREGYNTAELIKNLKTKSEESEMWHLLVIDIKIPNISSTEIRNKINNKENINKLIP